MFNSYEKNIYYFPNQQPTTNNQQPTTNNQQPTTNNQQPTTNNQQLSTNHLFFLRFSLKYALLAM